MFLLPLFAGLALAAAQAPAEQSPKAEVSHPPPAAAPSPKARRLRHAPLVERVIGDGRTSGVQAVLPGDPWPPVLGQGRAPQP